MNARLLLLGASNVRRVLPEIVREARTRIGGPLEVLVSHGSGRSYLGPSLLLGRGLDAIARDPFWAFEASAPLPTFAILADAGNDLAYGARPEPIAAAIERNVARLARNGARTVVVGLPVATLAAIGPSRFHLARALLFPTRRVERARLVDDARDLDARLAAIAHDHGAAFVAPRGEWYGIDPIHVRRGARDEAARVLCESFGARGPVLEGPVLEGILLERAALGRLKPAACTWFGRHRSCPQPSARLADGTRVSWF